MRRSGMFSVHRDTYGVSHSGHKVNYIFLWLLISPRIFQIECSVIQALTQWTVTFLYVPSYATIHEIVIFTTNRLNRIITQRSVAPIYYFGFAEEGQGTRHPSFPPILITSRSGDVVPWARVAGCNDKYLGRFKAVRELSWSARGVPWRRK